MPRYIKVTAQGQPSDEITELPLEDDNSLPLADVTAQFPGAVGLKARVGENSTRAVKLRESLLYPLEASEEEETIFVVVQQTKRSRDEDSEEDTRSKASKLPQLELIVLGLPFEETQEGVKTYFEKYGEVSEVDIKTFPNGKSRGFCFVTFKDEDVVKQVAAEQHTIGGRSCTVKVPYKRDERAPYGQRGPPAQAVTKLFIGKLPETINETMLRQCFSEFGALKDVYIPNRPFRGIAYVEFVERDGMDKALATTHTVEGVELNVSMATPRTYNPAYANGGAGGGGGGGRYGGYGNQGANGYYQNQQQDGYRNQGNHSGYGQAQRGAHQQWGGRGGWNGGAAEGQGGYARGAGIQQGGYGAGGYTYHAQQQGGYQGGWNNGGAY